MPRTKHPEETRRKIIDAAQTLFLQKGYEQTTILDIVAELEGLTRGAFYHHFKSKEEVMDAIMDAGNERRNPFPAVAREKNLTGLEKVKRLMIVSATSNMDTPEHRDMAKMALSLLDNPRFLAEQVKSNKDTAKDLALVIQQGMDDGSIRQGNALLLAELFMLIFNFWFFPQIYPFTPQEAEDKMAIAKQIFDSLGMPIIDDEIIATLDKLATQLDWENQSS